MSPSSKKTPIARVKVVGKPTPVAHVTVDNGPTFKTVQLLIHKVACEKTTKEVDRDEIILAAVKTEGEVLEQGGKKKIVGKAKKGEILDAGKFKKGENQSWSKPKVLAEFNLGARDLPWPRGFFATLVMIEKDEGDIGAVVNAAVNAVEKQVVAAVTQVAGAAAGGVAAAALAGSAAGSVVPIVGTAVGAAAGAIAAGTLGAIKNARKDDVFPLESVDVQLKSYPRSAGELPSSKQVAHFKGFKGHYKVIYSWSVK